MTPDEKTALRDDTLERHPPPNRFSESVVSVRPVAHFIWQVLRAVKRSRTAPTGRHLRLVPTRRTKDGTFLNELVDEGLLTRVTGSADAPFEATYTLTELGEHAAEYGEYDHAPLRPDVPEAPPSAPKTRSRPKIGKRTKYESSRFAQQQIDGPASPNVSPGCRQWFSSSSLVQPASRSASARIGMAENSRDSHI